MSQLEYEHKGGKYFAGAAVHTRQYPINEDGEMVSADESKGKTTCGWWIYGEQSVWKAGDKNISCMVQYSENTSHQNACYRYAELGGAYQDDKNECGLSGQYARFQQGSEYSLEVTWKKTADGIHIPSAIVPIHQKRQWRFHGTQCPTLCQFLAIHFGKTRVPITRKG